MAKTPIPSWNSETAMVQPAQGYIAGSALKFNFAVPSKVYARSGVVTTSGSQAFADKALSGWGDDYFNGWWMIFRGNGKQSSTTMVAGEMSQIQDYTSISGTFAFTGAAFDWAGTLQEGDEFELVPPGVEVERWSHIRNAITYAAGTTGAAATRELFTVTGSVRCRLLARCTTDMTSGANPALSLGVATDTDLLVADTDVAIAGANGLDAGELWYKTTAHPESALTDDAMFDFIANNGDDIGTDNTGGGTITGGVMVYELWWQPLTAGSKVVVAAGTGTL